MKTFPAILLSCAVGYGRSIDSCRFFAGAGERFGEVPVSVRLRRTWSSHEIRLAGFSF